MRRTSIASFICILIVQAAVIELETSEDVPTDLSQFEYFPESVISPLNQEILGRVCEIEKPVEKKNKQKKKSHSTHYSDSESTNYVSSGDLREDQQTSIRSEPSTLASATSQYKTSSTWVSSTFTLDNGKTTIISSKIVTVFPTIIAPILKGEGSDDCKRSYLMVIFLISALFTLYLA